MYFQATLLAVAPLLMMARADHIDFDLDDTPQACRAVCRPVADLARACEVDLPGDNNDRQEDQLEAQCFCTNDSFDVGSITAQCQDCISQNSSNRRRDHDSDDDHDHDDHYDAAEDINSIVRVCGFSSTSFVASAAPTSSIAVSASRPTNTADLTTTIDPAQATETGGSGGGGGGGDDAAGMVAPSVWLALAAVAGGAALLA